MRVSVSKKFRKQLKVLPNKVQQQFFVRLQLFTANRTHPSLRVHKLSGSYRGYQSFNVTADVRVVYRELGDSDVFIIAIGTHSQLYGK